MYGIKQNKIFLSLFWAEKKTFEYHILRVKVGVAEARKNNIGTLLEAEA